MGLLIADLQLRIVDCVLGVESIGNQQSQIDNAKTHPLPRGGTDLTANDRVSYGSIEKPGERVLDSVAIQASIHHSGY